MLRIKKKQLKNNLIIRTISTSTKLILVLVFFCLLLFPYSKHIDAYSIQPAITEFELAPLDESSGTLSFTNTTPQTQDFKIYSHRYNPQKEEIIDERNFIELEMYSTTLAENETAEIPYTVKIPDDTLPGSYFSIIVVESVEDAQDESKSAIGINYGLGALVAIHIADDADIAEIFLSQTEIELTYKKPLNPLKTYIEYKIKNNSKYTFTISGQLGVQSKNQKTKPTFFQLNPDAEKLYPNAELTFSYVYRGTWKDFIENKQAIVTTGNQFSENLRTNEIEIPYLNQTATVLIAIFVILTTIIVAKILVKKQGNKISLTLFRKKLNVKTK